MAPNHEETIRSPPRHTNFTGLQNRDIRADYGKWVANEENTVRMAHNTSTWPQHEETIRSPPRPTPEYALITPARIQYVRTKKKKRGVVVFVNIVTIALYGLF